MPGSIPEDLITLFVVLDPIGSIPIFLNATEELDSRDRPRVALVAVLVALLVLMLFLYCGQYALEAMHISIPAFRIAGAADPDRGRDFPGGDARHRQPGRAARGRALDRQRPVLFEGGDADGRYDRL